MPSGYLCPLGAIGRGVSELSSDEVEAAHDHCGYLQSWYLSDSSATADSGKAVG